MIGSTRFLAGAILMAMLVPQVHAQPSNDIYVSLIVGIPHGTFAEYVDEWGGGLSLTMVKQAGDSPVFFGSDISLVGFGIDWKARPGDPDYASLDSRSFVNAFATLNLLLRMQPTEGRVRPFLEVLGGAQYAVVKRGALTEDNEPEAESWAPSFGVGGGVNVHAYRGRFGYFARPVNLVLFARARYIFGGFTDYYALDPDATSPPYRRHATTAMVLPSIGIGLSTN